MILKNSLRLYSGGTQRVRDHSTEIKENFKENLGAKFVAKFLDIARSWGSLCKTSPRLVLGPVLTPNVCAVKVGN
jgi:hypothetical protein